MMILTSIMPEYLILMRIRMGAPARDTSFQVIVFIIIVIMIIIIIVIVIIIIITIAIITLLTVYLLKTDDREVGNSEQQNLPSIVIRQTRRAVALSSGFTIQEAKQTHKSCLNFQNANKTKYQSMHSICYLAKSLSAVSDHVTNNITNILRIQYK